MIHIATRIVLPLRLETGWSPIPRMHSDVHLFSTAHQTRHDLAARKNGALSLNKSNDSIRRLFKPILEGNNKDGRKGRLKCANCRKQRSKVEPNPLPTAYCIIVPVFLRKFSLRPLPRAQSSRTVHQGVGTPKAKRFRIIWKAKTTHKTSVGSFQTSPPL